MQLIMVKLDRIKASYNARKDFSKVAEIAKSIEAKGLLVPIVISPIGTTDRINGPAYAIIDGSQRLAALRQLGQSETQAIVIDYKNPSDSIEAGLIANLMRSNLTMIEKARGMAHLMKEGKYIEKTISRVFGIKESDVKFLLRLAARIHPDMDGKMTQFARQVDRDDIEMIMAVPQNHQSKLFTEMERLGEPNVWAAIHRVAYPLDFNDVFKFEQAKADGKIGFSIKKHGIDHVFTFDKKYHDEAVAAYERRHGEKYGANEGRRATDAEKKTKDGAAKKKKAREENEKASKTLPAILKQFISNRATEAGNVSALGQFLCDQMLDADACRRLWKAFNVKGIERVNTYELRKETWKRIFLPMTDTSMALVQLFTFLKIERNVNGKSTEAAWIAGMQKKKC